MVSVSKAYVLPVLGDLTTLGSIDILQTLWTSFVMSIW